MYVHIFFPLFRARLLVSNYCFIAFSRLHGFRIVDGFLAPRIKFDGPFEKSLTKANVFGEYGEFRESFKLIVCHYFFFLSFLIFHFIFAHL